MKYLTGQVYRAPSGYWHTTNTTIADVLAFESEELGNDDNLLPDVDPELLTAAAKHCTWVAFDPQVASWYGHEIQTINVIRAPFIGSDGSGGLLIYHHYIHC